MKHGLLSFFAAAVLIFVTLPCKAYNFSAVAPSGQTLYYNIVNGGVQVTPRSNALMSYYSSLVGDLIIPDTVTYNGSAYPVTSIGDNALGSLSYGACTSLTSVTIPNSVTSIGYYTFGECVIDTLNMSHIVPFYLGTGNTALRNASIINIPCGATANYQSIWGADNYHEPDPAVLTLSALDNNGIVTIDSQNVQQSPLCVGSTVFIQATPNYGYHFTQWNDGNTDNPRTITVTQDFSLTAIFAIDTHLVSAATNNELYGNVSGGGYFPYGSTVTLTPNPENGYYFVWWNNSDTTNPNTFTVTGDTLLSALFAPEIVPSICMVSVENDHNVLSWDYAIGRQYHLHRCERPSRRCVLPSGHNVVLALQPDQKQLHCFVQHCHQQHGGHSHEP